MSSHTITFRETSDADFQAIMDIQTRAFGYPKEAELTANMLADETAKPYLSLFALSEGKPVGHILFTRAYLGDRNPNQPLFHILAPLAIAPEAQNMGIGGKLIEEGHRRLREQGSHLVLVLGHPEYYPKHGFVPGAEAMGFKPPHFIPEEHANAWMVQYLSPASETTTLRGSVLCCEELNKPEHWRE